MVQSELSAQLNMFSMIVAIEVGESFYLNLFHHYPTLTHTFSNDHGTTTQDASGF